MSGDDLVRIWDAADLRGTIMTFYESDPIAHGFGLSR
jgi:hypothetical protein